MYFILTRLQLLLTVYALGDFWMLHVFQIKSNQIKFICDKKERIMQHKKTKQICMFLTILYTFLLFSDFCTLWTIHACK